MKPSIIISILALAALAAILFIAPAYAYVPKYDPGEIAVDASGNVYAIMEADSATGEGIFVYSHDGSELQAYRRPRCSDIAIDSNGTVYVVYLTGRQVERLEKNGSFSVVWGEKRPGYFINYFTVDRNNDILVSDYNYSDAERRISGGSILKLGPDGKVKSTIESTPDLSLTKYYRLSASNNGTTYLTFFNSSFVAIDPDGNRSMINCSSPANGTLSGILTVEAGADGYIYVGDSGNGRVMKLAPNGSTVAEWKGCGPDRFMSPMSIVADQNGRVYVSDPWNQRIVWFDGNKYKFGSAMSQNIAGKGVLWGNIIAGDNYTVAHGNDDYSIQKPPGSPGFGGPVALTGLCFAGAILFLGRMRRG